MVEVITHAPRMHFMVQPKLVKKLLAAVKSAEKRDIARYIVLALFYFVTFSQVNILSQRAFVGMNSESS